MLFFLDVPVIDISDMYLMAPKAARAKLTRGLHLQSSTLDICSAAPQNQFFKKLNFQ